MARCIVGRVILDLCDDSIVVECDYERDGVFSATRIMAERFGGDYYVTVNVLKSRSVSSGLVKDVVVRYRFYGEDARKRYMVLEKHVRKTCSERVNP